MITLNFFFVGLGKCVRIDGATLLRAFCLASLDDVRELKEKKRKILEKGKPWRQSEETSRMTESRAQIVTGA